LPLFQVGKCVPYYSVPLKSEVQYCIAQGTEGISRLCSTGVCLLNNTSENGVGTCIDNAVSTEYEATCDTDEDCTATIATTGTTITGDCQCGFSASGNAYCNAFSGDPPSLTVLSLYKEHLNNTAALATCHTLDRFSEDCLTKTLNATAYTSLVKNELLSEDLPSYMDNDYCTQLIINEDFYQESLSELQCPSWTCAGFNMTQCLIYEEGSNSVFLNSCGSGLQMYGGLLDITNSYCDTSSFSSYRYANVSCEALPAASGLYPGSSCSSNSACISGVCTSGICVGLAEGSSCSLTQDCNLGLHCNSTKFCSSLINAGQDGCESDFDCALNSACNLVSGTGKCVELMSLKKGDAVTCSASNGHSLFCETGTCTITNAVTSAGTCTSAPKLSSGTFPKICGANSDCVGSNSEGETFSSSCDCGYNQFGHSYCQAFPGDEPWAIFLPVYKTVTQTNSVTACHSQNRYSGACLDALAQQKNLDLNDAVSVLYYNATNYGDFLYNDACVKATVNSYYWGENPTPVDPDDHDHDDDDDFAYELMASAVLLAYFV
jgi:hypothetical protein